MHPMRFVAIICIFGISIWVGLIGGGCDTTADRELNRAQEALDKALHVGADEHATEDYTRAEQLLVQAQEMARQGKVSEARRLAVEAKILADDAYSKALERQKILEEEASRIGR